MLRFLLPLLLLGALLLAICTAAQSLPIEQSPQTDDAAASATPPVSAVFNCAALADCAACISATFDWADLAAVDVLPDEPSSSMGLPSNKPCGWCMSSWKCLNGDNNAPSAPLYCNNNWSFQSCAWSADCGGRYCNAVQTCKRHTEDDGSETTFKCVIATGFLIGVIVGGVLLCSLLVTCGVCYRRRKLARESGFATFSEPYTTTQPIAHEHAYHQYA